MSEPDQITGTIRPVGEDPNFNCEAWCQFVASRAEFRPRVRKPVPNPFKPGEFLPPAQHKDSAEIVVDGRVVGYVHWSMLEEPLAVVYIEPSQIVLAQNWAAAPGGVFQEETW